MIGGYSGMLCVLIGYGCGDGRRRDVAGREVRAVVVCVVIRRILTLTVA